MNDPLAGLAYAHNDLPPISARFSGRPEDFCVDEIMAPPAPGKRYVWLRLRRQNQSTAELVARLAAAFGVANDAIAWSGRKDKTAIATQWLALPADAFKSTRLPDDLEILATCQSDERLTLGRHSENAFVIRLDCPTPMNLDAWRHRLSEVGFPNYFGPQRFGDGDAVATGERLLRGDLNIRGSAARLCLNAWQSQLFNQALSAWLAAGQPQSKQDLVWHVRAATALPRSAWPTGDVTGPLFGDKTPLPGDESWRRELAFLQAAGWDWPTFCRQARRLRLHGARRTYWQKPRNFQLNLAANGLLLSFSLPPGSYATSLVRELTRS